MTKRMRWFLVIGVALALAVGFTSCGGGGGGGKKPKAQILGITPTNGPEAGGTVVTIDTKNFKDDFQVNLPTVNFGATPAALVVAVDVDTVNATSPTGPAGGGIVDIQVVASVSGRNDRLASAFTYDPAPPQCTVTNVVPSSGSSSGSTSVIISGTDFENDPATSITFGGVAATGFQYFSANQIGCTTPPYPAGGLVDVRVVSANRDCTLANAYDYILPPSCSITLPLVPANGPLAGGTTVQIQGTGFDATTTVTFGGVMGLNFTFIASTLITVDTPADPLGQPAGNYAVDVAVNTGAGANCSQPNAYMYDAVTTNCNILSINPPNGDQGGGTAVVITGTDFMPLGITDPVVLFGGTAGTVTAATNTQIDVTTPAAIAAGAVDVQVDNETGGTCLVVGGFTYDPPVGPACTITNITPAQGDAAGGTLVTIDGTNFDPTNTGVFFDGVSATNILPTATQITCNTPPGATVGFVDVDIVPGSGQPCTAVNGFEYTGCTFTVSPNQGQPPGGNVVTIDGVGIEANTAQAFFGGVESPSYVSRTAGQIVCEVPASPIPAPGLGPVDVQVVNPVAGTNCTLLNGYTYVGCTVTSVTPNTGPRLGGNQVTVAGSGFDTNGAFVFFGDSFATNVTVGSVTSITCDVPPSCTSGTVDVEVVNNNGQRCLLANAYTYDVPGSPVDPTVTSINPTSGGIAGGIPVTIMGTNFDTNGASVLFVDPSTNAGTVATNVVVVSTTQIDCDNPPSPIPNGVGFVDVYVINDNGGCGSLPGSFEYILQTSCNQCTTTSMSPDPVANPLNVAGEATARTINGDEFCVGLTINVHFFQIGFPPALGSVQNVTVTTVDVITPAAPGGAGPVDILIESGPFFCGPIVGEFQ